MAGRARVSGVWVPPEPKGETQLALIALRTLRAKMCLPEMVAVDTLPLTDLRQLTVRPVQAQKEKEKNPHFLAVGSDDSGLGASIICWRTPPWGN